jgi:PAS domain S-box-containing protein
MASKIDIRRVLYSAVLLSALLTQLVIAILGWEERSGFVAWLDGAVIVVALVFSLLLAREIGRRDRAERALMASEERFRDFVASSSDWLWESDAEHRFTWFNERIQDAWFTKQSALGRTRFELGCDDQDEAKWAAHRADLDARREFRNFQYALRDLSGRLRHVRISGRPVFGPDGTFRGYRGTALDVTAEIEARAEAERASARLAEALGSIAESFALFDADDRLVICNQHYAERNRMQPHELKGWTFAEILNLTAADRIDPDTFGGNKEEWIQWRLEQHRNPSHPISIKYSDGTWQRITESRTRDGGIVHVSTDFTETKNRETELQTRVAQQNSVALLAQLALDPVDLNRLLAKATDLVARTLGEPVSSIYELSGDGREFVLRASTGRPRDEIGTLRLPVDESRLIGHALKIRGPVVSPDLAGEMRFTVHPAIRARGYKSVMATTIGAGPQPFGIITCASYRSNAFPADSINFIQAVANVLASAIQLRQQEARLRAILDNSVDAILSFDEQGRVQSANQAVERMFGVCEADIIDRPITLLLAERHRSSFEAEIEHHIASGSTQIARRLREIEGLRRDGAEFPIDLGLRELRLGSRRIFIATMHDATERKATEQHLRHAQKMEAVGQLTGGIAHDFNNLLTIILGNAEMLLEALPPSGTTARMQAEMVISAATSGARLTQRLLAFARQQALAAIAFDANDLVLRTTNLLQRALGEHIAVKHRLARDLPLVFADPSQLENAVVNLAVNARDAMPDGGTLTITTARVHLDDAPAAFGAGPGDYVMLAVSDTGVGMTPQVLGRVFEPFFTTKEVGKGTGLGLSMVYGFITQSRGHVRIDSEVGKGTTVKLYLPLAPAGVEEATLPAESAHVPRGTGTILLVEDNAEVRRLTANGLRSLGYEVVEASDGPSALAIIETGRHVDLLFSDVVMPGGMDGRELAMRIRATRPNLPVLLASGFAETPAAGATSVPFEIMTKPFSKRLLAQRVRAALDSARGAAPAAPQRH